MTMPTTTSRSPKSTSTSAESDAKMAQIPAASTSTVSAKVMSSPALTPARICGSRTNEDAI